jgi:hypothetical protein
MSAGAGYSGVFLSCFYDTAGVFIIKDKARAKGNT